MPAGTQERRRANRERAESRLALNDDAYSPPAHPSHENGHLLSGTVIQVSAGLCQVEWEGNVVSCGYRGSLKNRTAGYTNVVAVGDRVIISVDGPSKGVVEEVLPRQSVLVRRDVFHEHLQQIIVANVDQVLIVSSWQEPPIWLELIDRYLISAQRNHLASLICINKIDLAPDHLQCQAVMRPYLDLGYSVVYTSAVESEGIEEIREMLRRRTTVLAGLSGVGKSSLLAAVQPGLKLRIGEVSEASGEGRHTTTQVTLQRLGCGGFVVDTPGIREFGLAGMHRSELGSAFPEIARLEAACRFADCAHLQEPGCAVQTALQEGRIAASRYHSYRAIYDSLPA